MRKKIVKKAVAILIPSFFSLSCLSINNLILIKDNPNDILDRETFNSFNLKNGIKSSYNLDIKTYFQNLYDYSPWNNRGSCGYVSSIQILSYYDTFYNDNFIPTKYEQNQGVTNSYNQMLKKSPGVLQAKTSIKNEDNSEIIDYINSTKDSSFLSYLIYTYNNERKTFNENKFTYEIGMWNYSYIFNKLYPNFELGFQYIKASNFGSYDNSKVINFMTNFVKDELDKGKPVILHVKGYYKKEVYHSVPAYYYDDQGIHCNFGWYNQDTDVIIDSKSLYITEAGSFNFDSINHVHSFHYNYNDEGYCGCGYHEHIHNYFYTWKDYETHYIECSCNYKKSVGHVIKSSDLNNGSTYATCLLCGGKAKIGFALTSLINNNSISENGSYIRDDGIIVISNKDYDEIENGNLTYKELLNYEN